jgi:protein tyrosine/serine phosphatase
MRARIARRLLLVLLLCIGAVAAYVLHLVAADNFHVVSPGQVYRSSQMNSNALAQIIHEYGIKSILNLRGEKPKDAWYPDETNTASQLGVKHFDFALSAAREVTDKEIEQILAIIRDAPKPVLIHCQAGADRTGLVSALYCLAIESQTPVEADKQLTVWYGHVPLLQTMAMDRSFWRYVSNRTARAELNLQPDLP